MKCASQTNLLGCVIALALIGCDRTPSPSPPPIPSQRQIAVEPNPERILCPGGLLCEAPATMLGWRVPAGCERQASGRRVQTCWLAAAEFDRVLEFFQTRYRVETLPEGAAVHPRLAPAAGADPPLLHVLRRAQGVELVAMAGSGTDVTP